MNVEENEKVRYVNNKRKKVTSWNRRRERDFCVDFYGVFFLNSHLLVSAEFMIKFTSYFKCLNQIMNN